METDLRWFGVVYMLFGANRRNKNAFKCVLQVLISYQKHNLWVLRMWFGVVKRWFGVIWMWFGVVWGVLGWFGVFPRTPQRGVPS